MIRGQWRFISSLSPKLGLPPQPPPPPHRSLPQAVCLPNVLMLVCLGKPNFQSATSSFRNETKETTMQHMQFHHTCSFFFDEQSDGCLKGEWGQHVASRLAANPRQQLGVQVCRTAFQGMKTCSCGVGGETLTRVNIQLVRLLVWVVISGTASGYTQTRGDFDSKTFTCTMPLLAFTIGHMMRFMQFCRRIVVAILFSLSSYFPSTLLGCATPEGHAHQTPSLPYCVLEMAVWHITEVNLIPLRRVCRAFQRIIDTLFRGRMLRFLCNSEPLTWTSEVHGGRVGEMALWANVRIGTQDASFPDVCRSNFGRHVLKHRVLGHLIVPAKHRVKAQQLLLRTGHFETEDLYTVDPDLRFRCRDYWEARHAFDGGISVPQVVCAPRSQLLGAHRALCPCCAKSRLFFTTCSHGSQGPQFCTPNGSCTLL